MTTLTVSLQQEIKTFAKLRARKEGVTLTFVIQQLLDAYNKGAFEFGMRFSDDSVTKSFDVSTSRGKKECLDDFTSLMV